MIAFLIDCRHVDGGYFVRWAAGSRDAWQWALNNIKALPIDDRDSWVDPRGWWIDGRHADKIAAWFINGEERMGAAGYYCPHCATMARIATLDQEAA